MITQPQKFVYQPGKWAQRIDKVVGVFSPSRAMKRELDRYRYQLFRHQAALSNPGRRNSYPTEHYGETIQGDRERRQLQWNSLELIDNSGLAEGIRRKMVQYICGTLRFQMRTANKNINTLYEAYMKEVCGKAIDASGRNSLRKIAGLCVSGTIVKGDVGLNIVGRDVRVGPQRKRVIQLQGIEADRIGDPYAYMATKYYVGGVHLDEAGGAIAYDIFERDRNNTLYKFEERIPARDDVGLPRFLHTMNPISFDEVRGRTAFRVAIDQISYLNDMRKWELMAMLWAGSRAGVYYTNNGELPEDMPFQQNATELPVDRFGNRRQQIKIEPNMLTALGTAERMEMFQSDRPSPNVIGMYNHVIREIAGSIGLSYGLVFDMTGVTGPAIRTGNKQDARTFKTWQENLAEDVLDPVAFLIIGAGIDNKDIPFHPDWLKWAWGFPASISIDSGRDAYADIALKDSAVQSGANIAAEAADDIEDIHGAISRESQNLIELAIDTAENIKKTKGKDVPWEMVLSLMVPKGAGGKSVNEGAALTEKALAEAAAKAEEVNPEKAGATSEGSELE